MRDISARAEAVALPDRHAVVARLFAEDGYGFLLTDDCREVRFSRDVVAHDEFDELRVGSEVCFAATNGTSGRDATVVDMINVPYPAPDEDPEMLGAEDEVPEMPDTWKEE